MKKNSLIVLMNLLLLFTATSLFAQGTIRGVIKDSLTAETLVGANVFLEGTSLGSATDIEGEYRIPRVPEGTYRLRISYIGYKPRTITVAVADNRTVIVNESLSPDFIESSTIVVSAQALGQAAAINQQKSSNTIINVVSEEKIKELPDANAAEAIGRLPGVSILRSGGEANKIILRGLSDQYTNVTIDGVKIASTDASSRGLDLSTISQSSLAGIELYKALTADKDADAIAGSVNLVTKKAPALREVQILAKGIYNNLMNSFNNYDFSAKYGERFFDDVVGVQITGNVESRIRSNERINIDYDQTILNQTSYEINNFALQFTDETRERNGISLILDTDTPDDGSIKLNTVYNSTNRNYLTSARDYPAGGGTGGAVTYSYRDREQSITTFNTSLTGNNNLIDLNWNWGLSFAQSKSAFPFDFYLDFLEPSTGTSGMKSNFPKLKDQPELLIPFAYNNFNAASMYSGNYRTQDNIEKQKTVFLNITKKYLLDNNLSGDLKIGAKYKSMQRINNNTLTYAPYFLGYWQPYQKNEDGSVTSKDLSGTLFDAFWQRYLQNNLNNTLAFSEFLDNPAQSRDLFNDLYKLNPLINRDKLQEWYALNKNGVDKSGKLREFSEDPSAKANYYDVLETVTSAYVMNTLNIGQFVTFIAGFRVEKEMNDYKSKWSPIQTGGFPIPPDASRDTTASHSETVYLPNFHLNIKPSEFINIRLAAYKALARPDFNYRLNTYFAWRANTSAGGTYNKQLILGNPLLKTAQAWNFEINTSFYGNEIGLISVSAFYKQIKDMYHQLNGINTTGNTMIKNLGLDWNSLHTGTYSLTVPYNSPKDTKVWGFEFEHQISLGFLPGLLRNIVISYNASAVRSETWLIASRTDTTYEQKLPPPFPKTPVYSEVPIQVKQQLENQPEFFGNISVGYDIGGFSARVSLFHQSQYNLSFSPSGRSDQVINGYTRLDLALKHKFDDHLELMLNVSNLTNIKEENSILNNVNNYKILNTSERYGVTADFGVRYSL